MATTMTSSLGRAFTKRQKRPEVSAPMPFREGQPRFAAGTIKRSKISAPIELISTTNLLAYTAPDIQKHNGNNFGAKSPPVVSRPPVKHPHQTLAHSTSSSSSFRSADESDASNSLRTPSTTLTSPSLPPSAESSPILRDQSNPNPLACYFDQKDSPVSSPRETTPSIPSRALSHTKKSHQELSRQRSSASTSSGPKNTSISATHASHSAASRGHAQDTSVHAHPFGKELEQVNEVAEEFSVGNFFRDEDERILADKGLIKVDVVEYLKEVQGVYAFVFGADVASRDWI
ncbi:uncharacterized protein GIQ15_03314 [Arthroderma uncinatum]|uniref:uncharacterized protein n=1 Tax=Arthroderma uncinatum TaxID=74035 RepID=UPI00144AF8F5|nr:uncharacterized protein GIQ15_03314 [Arthroderma uncinatum]KAF3483990.1 hypothetical protein GIQ15_03314 [Arthroderma uncinatum]